MADRLILGTRRYSSWSMRGWLAVRLAGLALEDLVVPLAGGVTHALAALTPAGLVPVLDHGGTVIWDSLAICEYCAEQASELWPAARADRAVARSVAAEMHSGFRALRQAMPMNLGRLDIGAKPPADVAEAVAQDIARIDAVWRQCLAAHGGPYLFGATPTIPDVMYAPVVARLLSYAPDVSAVAAGYCRTIRSYPLVDRWYRLALAEPLEWRLPRYE